MKNIRSLLLIAVFLLGTAISCRAQGAGNTPPDFTATAISGAQLTLSGLKGKVVLLDFWATWCPPCRVEIPNLLEIHRKFKDKGFVLVSVSLDRDLAGARKFVKDKEMDWVHIIDWDVCRDIAGKYGVEYIPSTFLINRKGKLEAIQLRGSELEDRIAALLQ
jgi:thiol-disulfide isomerase/thioredoxin